MSIFIFPQVIISITWLFYFARNLNAYFYVFIFQTKFTN